MANLPAVLSGNPPNPRARVSRFGALIIIANFLSPPTKPHDRRKLRRNLHLQPVFGESKQIDFELNFQIPTEMPIIKATRLWKFMEKLLTAWQRRNTPQHSNLCLSYAGILRAIKFLP